MANLKSSTLPPVLKEYAPEYEPQHQQVAKTRPPKGSKRNQKEAGARKEAQHDKPTGGGHRTGEEGRGKSADSSERRPPSGPVRERTRELQRRQDQERYGRNFENWQQIKQDTKEEETLRLRRRVAVQHELIRAQEETSEQRRRQKEDEEAKRRGKLRANKQAQTEALLQICKESLAEDRKKAAEQKSQKQKDNEDQPKKNEDTSITESGQPPGEKTATKDEEEEGEEGAPLTTSNLSRHSSLTGTQIQETEERCSPIREVTDEGFLGNVREDLDGEELEEEDEDEEEEDEEAEVPWHHQQLYDLYGKQADYFLYPKFQQDKKVASRPLQPRIKKLAGQGGAKTLWTTLRKESRMKLLKEDSHMEPELKLAFGAFVRQSVSRRQRPIRRNFYAEEDVPEMARLMDQSNIRNAQDFRHKVELMFRSSHINEDRSKVLLFNNPIPDLNDKQGEESVNRYLPSWLGDCNDAASEMSYKKWLSPRIHTQAPNSRPPSIADSGLSKSDLGTSEWDYSRQRINSKPKSQCQTPRYVFLTEADTECEGQFAQRRKELLKYKNIPKAYSGAGNRPRSVAEALESDRTGSSRDSTLILGEDTARSREDSSRKPSRQSSSSQRFVSNWQPLSLSALEGYKGSTPAPGQGNFSQGKAPVWAVKTAS